MGFWKVIIRPAIQELTQKKALQHSFMKTLCFACFPLLKPYHTHKLDFKSQECVFLGYSSSHKGYKCLSSTGRIYISKDVLFNELRFPYLDLFSSSCSSTQNITSYFNLNLDLSPPVSAFTPSLSQIPSSNSLSAPSVPSDFSITALNQTSSESTSTHPIRCHLVNLYHLHPLPLTLNHQILCLIVNLCLHQLEFPLKCKAGSGK